MKGLLFRPELAAKIKTGRKTQTRRPLPCNVKEGEILFVKEATWVYGTWGIFGTTKGGKEKFRFIPEEGVAVKYTDEEKPGRIVKRIAGKTGYTLRSPLHCRAKDARLFLKVTGRKDEPLQGIPEVDALAEGVEPYGTEREEHDWSICSNCGGTLLYTSLGANLGVNFDTDCTQCETAYVRFRTLWDSLNGTDPAKCWSANPTVAVITFEVTDNPFKK